MVNPLENLVWGGAVAGDNFAQAGQTKGEYAECPFKGWKYLSKAPAKSSKVEVPAEYATVKTQKLVAAAEAKREAVPAQFKDVEKRVLVSDAKVVWRLQGSQGPGKATGQVLCLADVPAKYTTVTKQVKKAEASTKEVPIPAKYETGKGIKPSMDAVLMICPYPCFTISGYAAATPLTTPKRFTLMTF